MKTVNLDAHTMAGPEVGTLGEQEVEGLVNPKAEHLSLASENTGTVAQLPKNPVAEKATEEAANSGTVSRQLHKYTVGTGSTGRDVQRKTKEW